MFLLLLLVWTYIMFIYIFFLHLQHQALTEAMSEKKPVNTHMHWDLLLYVALHLKEPWQLL